MAKFSLIWSLLNEKIRLNGMVKIIARNISVALSLDLVVLDSYVKLKAQWWSWLLLRCFYRQFVQDLDWQLLQILCGW